MASEPLAIPQPSRAQHKIIPTVLANSKEEFEARLQRLLPVADEIQVDIMDGQFVPSRSVAINDIPDMKRWPQKRFEAHLMVQTPGAHIQPMARRGFARVIFHIEAVGDKYVPALLAQCKKYGVKPVLAINPETPVERLLPYVNDIDGVLFLGVHPGFNGAPYVPETAARIARFIKLNPNKALPVQVDGGMTPDTIAGVVAAGAVRINSGSFVSNARDPRAALDALYKAAGDSGPARSNTPISGPVTGRIIAAIPVVPRSPTHKADAKKTTGIPRKSTSNSRTSVPDANAKTGPKTTLQKVARSTSKRQQRKASSAGKALAKKAGKPKATKKKKV